MLNFEYNELLGRSLDKAENVKGMPKIKFYNREPAYFPYFMHTNEHNITDRRLPTKSYLI